jgi:hypothetical protein
MYIIPRMRSIRQIADEYRKADPQTRVNQNFLRHLILRHEIPFVKAGKTFLI